MKSCSRGCLCSGLLSPGLCPGRDTLIGSFAGLPEDGLAAGCLVTGCLVASTCFAGLAVGGTSADFLTVVRFVVVFPVLGCLVAEVLTVVRLVVVLLTVVCVVLEGFVAEDGAADGFVTLDVLVVALTVVFGLLSFALETAGFEVVVRDVLLD